MLSGIEGILENKRHVVERVIDWRKVLFKEKMLYDKFLIRTQRIMEVMCGSGARISSLSHMCREIIGVEPDYGLFKEASDRSSSIPNVTLMNCDLLSQELSRDVKDGSLDAVLLMGNQLPKIVNVDNLEKTFKKIYSLLAKDGIVILSVFNYDRVLMAGHHDFEKVRFRIKDQDLFLSRNMKIFDEDILRYTMSIYTLSGKHVKEHTELQSILTKKALENWLKHTGFINIEIFGDFDMRDFSPETSSKMVVVAKK